MPQCSACNVELVRIHKRPIDRLISYFKPIMRYRCPQCGQVGNQPDYQVIMARSAKWTPRLVAIAGALLFLTLVVVGLTLLN